MVTWGNILSHGWPASIAVKPGYIEGVGGIHRRLVIAPQQTLTALKSIP
jgi:hypothetical protein